MSQRPRAPMRLLVGIAVLASGWPEEARGEEDHSTNLVSGASASASAEEASDRFPEWSLSTSPLGRALEPHRVNVSGHVAQGFTFNPDRPRDRQNFGRLFDDRANDYRFNQAMLTVERPLAPEGEEWDWGFKAQLMYGSDARFVHYLGVMDNLTDDTVQPDVVELYGNVHAPVLTKGGIDVKAGMFVTLMGAEVIPATGNPLYSHSYMFNFGIPFKHTGVMVTTHVTDTLDVHLGLVNGINTGFDDNNDALSFHGGLMWKLWEDKVVISPALHIGPENDTANNTTAGIDANDDLRYIVDTVVTVTPHERWTLITDLNWGRDEGFDAEWYGVAQYVIYKLNDKISLVARGEVWRDDDGFAAVQFADNDDPVNVQRGEFGALDPRTVGGGDTTYAEITLGVQFRPWENWLIRPEVRWDWADENEPFDDSSDDDQFTVGFDVIVSF
jgi:hypothetical protein